jgi:DNA (cytosine-5)-methyltransferase 1
MEEIAAIEWNGYSAISTFSGCGGSSLGYKMAGFKVLWASEFIPAAQETYRANHSGTILDTRDIRQVQASDILEAIQLEPGQLDLFDGSPPCASFSTAGKREAGWGKVKAYSDTKQRTDDLFFEYARLVKGIQPKVFVAENVSGLVKGTAKGYFLEILAALKECGYTVKAKLLDAQWLGVPQMRQRIFFIGVRNDLEIEPVHPMPLPYRYSVRDALPWIRALRLTGAPENWKDANRPAGTVVQSDANRDANDTAYMSAYLIEAETDISRYAIGAEWDKLKQGEQSEKYFQLVKPSLESPCPAATIRSRALPIQPKSVNSRLPSLSASVPFQTTLF